MVTKVTDMGLLWARVWHLFFAGIPARGRITFSLRFTLPFAKIETSISNKAGQTRSIAGHIVSKDYAIAQLWIDGDLTYLEQLCAVSFRDAGHHVKMYTYGDVGNIPDGIELCDANDILPQKTFLTHERTGSPALHSDLWRYKLLEKHDDIIWADTDAYCVKRFKTPNGHFYGWESKTHINGGVLGLPQDSETLAALLEYTNDEYAIPEWYGKEYRAELEAAKEAGKPLHAGEQPWGVWGPHAITHFLKKTGEARYALPPEGLYPFHFKRRLMMLRPGLDISRNVTDNTYSIHFYGRRMRRRLMTHEDGVPPAGSLLDRLIKKHKINPADAPMPDYIPQKEEAAKKNEAAKRGATVKAVKPREAQVPKVDVPQPPRIQAVDKYGRGQVNLTDLADKYGSDKGSTKHRYTELYNMLFQPFRKRAITLLEMGLQIGGPEHGKDAARETTDAPSVRIWLEYFEKAQIIGLDVSDFSWFKEDRFRFVQCDMDKRDNINRAAKDMGKLDIIIDDASHASHHQQFGFLELFPKLASGGLYVIEDLRWQPENMERDGFPKTADLFQSYLKKGFFDHPDPALSEEINALRIDISGCFVFQAHFNKNKRDQVLVVHKR